MRGEFFQVAKNNMHGLRISEILRNRPLKARFPSLFVSNVRSRIGSRRSRTRLSPESAEFQSWLTMGIEMRSPWNGQYPMREFTTDGQCRQVLAAKLNVHRIAPSCPFPEVDVDIWLETHRVGKYPLHSPSTMLAPAAVLWRRRSSSHWGSVGRSMSAISILPRPARMGTSRIPRCHHRPRVGHHQGFHQAADLYRYRQKSDSDIVPAEGQKK